MQTNRRTLFSCLSIFFAVAIFVISTNTTTAAETIPVSLIRPPTVYPSYRPLMVSAGMTICSIVWSDTMLAGGLIVRRHAREITTIVYGRVINGRNFIDLTHHG